MAGARYPTLIASFRTSGLLAAMDAGVGKALLVALPRELRDDVSGGVAVDEAPNLSTSLRVIFFVAPHSVFVVRIVLTTSSKTVGERSTLPSERFLARTSFGSPREAT